MTRIALGVDIGGTRVRIGVVSAAGEILARTEAPLPPEGEPAILAATVAEGAATVRREAGCSPEIAGVGVPGVWDRDTGVMQRAVNLPKLEGVNIRRLFDDALGTGTALDADVNAACWGQWRRMEPRPRRLVYLSLGTGVGGSVILDGQIVRHTHGGAGHFGFLVVDTSPDAPSGRNDVPGCLSAFVAGPALHLAATGKRDASAVGDEPLPDGVIAAAARALAVACLQLVHVYAPDAIALGGGVIDHHPEIVDRARAAFGQYQSRLTPAELGITRAPLSTREAGVAGAALLALETMCRRP